jgi:hypothetical protein
MRLGAWAAAVSVISALACGGDVAATPQPPPSTDWVGTWTGTTGGDAVLLTIDGDGGVHYQRSGSVQSSYDMPAIAWRSDGFDIGLSAWMSTSFHVDAAPHEDAGAYKMTVDGVELTREATAPEPEDAPPAEEPAVLAP